MTATTFNSNPAPVFQEHHTSTHWLNVWPTSVTMAQICVNFGLSILCLVVFVVDMVLGAKLHFSAWIHLDRFIWFMVQDFPIHLIAFINGKILVRLSVIWEYSSTTLFVYFEMSMLLTARTWWLFLMCRIYKHMWIIYNIYTPIYIKYNIINVIYFSFIMFFPVRTIILTWKAKLP